MLTVSLPQKFLDENVAIELNADFPILSGRILRFTETYLEIEDKDRFYLIPWISIARIWIAKEQETEK